MEVEEIGWPETLARIWNNSTMTIYLDEIKRSWLLKPQVKKRRKMNVDLSCVVCNTKALKCIIISLSAINAFILIAFPAIISSNIPKHNKPLPPPSTDNYTIALHKALNFFFNVKKSGKLSKDNGVWWCSDSGLMDGVNFTDDERALLRGYYDAGNNIKSHIPMSFSMTMLSWSCIEYEHKFQATGEYDHIRDLIKWGTDYILSTFQSNSSSTDIIYSQVDGVKHNHSPDDIYCWMRHGDIEYERIVQHKTSAPDLGAEMAAALASASIVFRDDLLYSEKLVSGADTVFSFAIDKNRRIPYSWKDLIVEEFYNSTGYWDEYIWSPTWMFFASGNSSYLSLATDSFIARKANADVRVVPLRVHSWDNKLPVAMLLLTRLRLFLDPGYPYDELLTIYDKNNALTMCSYLKKFKVFDFSLGGLIQLNNIRSPFLAEVVNAAFIASVYADYLTEFGAPGWYCGDEFISSEILRNSSISQVDYILDENPTNMSYVVGFGQNFPRQVHHRGASGHTIHAPRDGNGDTILFLTRMSLTEQWSVGQMLMINSMT